MEKLKQTKKRFESGKSKKTKNFSKQVEDFKKVGKQTFWVVTKSYEEYLTEISHGNRMKDNSMIEKMKEDLEFLKNMRLPERPGGIASLDKEYCKKIQKKKTLSKKADSQIVEQTTTLSSNENSSTDDEMNSEDKIYKPLSKKRNKQAEPKLSRH